METARTIARPHGLDVVPDARLREFDFGEWEGLTWTQIVERWPELAVQPYTEAQLYHPNGGESFDAVVARARSFLDDVQRLTDANVLVVTHAGALHALIEALGPNLRGRPSEPIVFTTASITRVAMEPDGPRLITLDNVDHLHPAP
jgi:broad specificity phosphatase PhoE